MNEIPDHDERSRAPKDNEYTIPSIKTNGRIVCCRPGMKLIDFYRTSPILAKDVPPPVEKGEVEK